MRLLLQHNLPLGSALKNRRQYNFCKTKAHHKTPNPQDDLVKVIRLLKITLTEAATGLSEPP